MRLAEVFVRAGKVRDLYRVGDDRLLLVASDRLSAFDVVLPTGIPDKGRVLTGLSRFWFAETASIVPNHLLSTDPADVPAEITDDDPDVVRMLRGRMMIGRQAEVLPIECVVRGYLVGLGLEVVPRRRGDLRDPAPVRPPRERPAAGSDLHARHQGAARRARREHLVRGHGDDRRFGARGTGRATHPSPSTATAQTVCERARDHPRRHQVRVRGAAFGRADPDRRGHDARLVAVLGRRRPIDPAGPQASFDKQYVRDWLEYAQDWDKTPPGPELPRTVVAGTRATLRRGLRAHHRRQLRPLPPGGRHRPMSEPTRAYRFAVNVTPKPGILDPQGRAVERSLPHLGIEGVAHVRVGRRVELAVVRGRRGGRGDRGRAAGRPSCCRTR